MIFESENSRLSLVLRISSYYLFGYSPSPTVCGLFSVFPPGLSLSNLKSIFFLSLL